MKMTKISEEEFRRDPKRCFYRTPVDDLPKAAVTDLIVTSAEFRGFLFETLAHDFGKRADFEEIGIGWVDVIRGAPSAHREFFFALARSRHAAEWRGRFMELFGSEFSDELAKELPGYFEPESEEDELI